MESLDVSNNQINENFLLLGKYLECWPKLKSLGLAECGLEGKEVVREFLEKFSFCKLIEVLNLSWNHLGNEGLKELTTTLENMIFLKELNICRCGGSDVNVMSTFLLCLKNKSNIKMLDLSHNYVGLAGLAVLIKYAPKSIEHLRLRFCQIKTVKNVLFLLKTMAGDGNLKILDMSNNVLGQKIVGLLLLKRKWMEKIEVMDFSENDVNYQIVAEMEQEMNVKFPHIDFYI